MAHPALYMLMFGGALSAHISPANGAIAEDALAPLIRSLAQALPHETSEQVGVRATVIWSTVHGAVSLQLSGCAPERVDWDFTYERLLDWVQSGVDVAVARSMPGA